jgi:hypothetical protein
MFFGYDDGMRKVRVLVFALLLSLLTTPISSAAETCSQLNVPSLADDNLTITVSGMTTTEKTGSYQLTITYKMLNGTSDKKIDEGSFKIFYTDGTSEPQYGFFGTFFPGDNKERSYTWEYLKSKTPMSISYNAGFFSSAPSPLKLNWAPPGQICNLVSPAAKAAADKAAADKAAADKAAADKAAADKAAADKAEAAIAAANAATDAANAKADAANKAAELAAITAQLNAKAAADAKTAANLALKLAKSKKASTITCVKGKLSKKVTGVNPKCPSGYKKK